MQKLITFGCMVDLVIDLAAVISDSSGTSTLIVSGLLPAAVAVFQLCRRVMGEPEDVAEFYAETIRR